MLINNKYENKCRECGRTIPIDTQVEWEKGKGIRHVICPTTESVFGKIRKYSFARARKLKQCQKCKTKFSKTDDKYFYENYRLCEKCWEETLGNG